MKLGRLSVGGAKPARNGIEDMLASVEGGKHDYDWYVYMYATIYAQFIRICH